MIDEYQILAKAIRYHIAATTHPHMKELEDETFQICKYFHGRGNRDYDIIYETVVRYVKEFGQGPLSDINPKDIPTTKHIVGEG